MAFKEYGQGVHATKYGKGQKAIKKKTQRRDLTPPTFISKDDPNYRQQYLDTYYTERQQRIINDEIPLDEIRLNQLTVILQKAEYLEDIEVIEKVNELKRRKEHIAQFVFTFTPEEAMDILQQLTPWEIDWS